MTSQIGQQTIVIYTLCIISRSKDNQARKFGQLIKHNKIYFFKNHAQNEVERLVPDLFLYFKKALYKAKASGQHLSLMYFGSPRLQQTIKTISITFQTVDPEICPTFIFYKRFWDKLLHHILCMIFEEDISRVIFY